MHLGTVEQTRALIFENTPDDRHLIREVRHHLAESSDPRRRRCANILTDPRAAVLSSTIENPADPSPDQPTTSTGDYLAAVTGDDALRVLEAVARVTAESGYSITDYPMVPQEAA